MQTDFPTPETIRAWVHARPAQITKQASVDEIVSELQRQSTPSAGAWGAGGMVRTLNKCGVPVPPTVGAIPAPTARNWMRAILLLALQPGATDGELLAACNVEMNREFTALDGKTGGGVDLQGVFVGLTPAPAIVATHSTTGPTDAEIWVAFRLRFPGWPEVRTPQSDAAVLKWVAANGRPFPDEPVHEPRELEALAIEVRAELREAFAAEVRDELRRDLREQVLLSLRMELTAEVRDELHREVAPLVGKLHQLRDGLAAERKALAARVKRASSDKPSDQVAGAACGT